MLIWHRPVASNKKTRRGEGEACCGLNGIAPITVKLPATLEECPAIATGERRLGGGELNPR